MNNGSRIAYLDALRLVSMAAVVVLHLSASGQTASAAGSAAWAVCWLYNFGARFAVPVFVMISGALFLDPGRKITMQILWKKHISNLLRVFLAWSFVYALAESAKEYALFTADYFLSVAQKTVTGHYHMWYLYLIGGLYLLTPLLREIAAREKLFKAVMIAALVLNPVTLIRTVPGSEIFALLTGYVGYYYLGYWLHHKMPQERKMTGFMTLSAILYAAVAGFGILAGIRNGESPDALLNVRMPFTMCYSVAVFLFFKRRFASSQCCAPMQRLIPCALGIYLVHPMVNFVLRKIGLHGLTFHPLVSIPLCAVLVCVLSYGIISVLRKIPAAKQFV